MLKKGKGRPVGVAPTLAAVVRSGPHGVFDYRSRPFMYLPSRPLVAAVVAMVAGCGASHGSAPNKPASGQHAHRQAPLLRPAGRIARLPAARSGAAVAAYSGQIVVSGGLSSAGSSTSTVFAARA